MPTTKTANEAGQLILAAFEVARATGRQDWRQMTAAVLKNRMLQMTSQSFDEGEYGFDRFTDLLDASQDIVELDRTTRPTTVHLIGDLADDASPATVASSPTMQIRSDLWHGIVDYSSRGPWVWDSETSKAMEADGADDLPHLPTMEKAEMAELRSGFAAEFLEQTVDQGAAKVVREWAADGLGNYVLPPDVRHRWNGVLKREVARRLDDFFERIEVPMPPDAVQVKQQGKRKSQDDDDAAMLRSVLRVVKCMTPAELSALALPAAAVFRSQRQFAKDGRR